MLMVCSRPVRGVGGHLQSGDANEARRHTVSLLDSLGHPSGSWRPLPAWRVRALPLRRGHTPNSFRGPGRLWAVYLLLPDRLEC